MKKNLLFTVLLSLAISGMAFGQDNLLINGSFEEPALGKLSANGATGDGAMGTQVPGWLATDDATDSGVQTDSKDNMDGEWCSFAYSKDGFLYQIVDKPVTTAGDMKLTYLCRYSWNNGNTDIIYYSVVYAYAVDGNDINTRVLIDSSANTGLIGEYEPFEFDFSTTADNIGKNLAIAIDVVAMAPEGTELADGDEAWFRYDNLVLVGDAISAIDNTVLDQSVSVYPNPGNGIINIKSEYPVVGVDLMDLTGRMIRTFDNVNRIDLNAQEKGLYLMRINTTEGNTTKKLIVE